MPSSEIASSPEEFLWKIALYWKVLVPMGITTDAIYHLLLLFVISMMVIPLKRRGLVVLILIIPASVEIVQFFMPSRVPDFMDAFYGYLGIILAYCLVQMWREIVPVLRKSRVRLKEPETS